jgi:hypothetical protein
MDDLSDETFFTLLLRALVPSTQTKHKVTTILAEAGKAITFQPAKQTGISIQQHLMKKDADLLRRWTDVEHPERKLAIKDFISGLLENNRNLQGSDYPFIRILEDLQLENETLDLQRFFENICEAAITFRERNKTSGPMTELERIRQRLPRQPTPVNGHKSLQIL